MLPYIHRLANFLPRTDHHLKDPRESLRLLDEILDKFWNRHPAMLYALAIAFGSASAFCWRWIYLIPLTLLFFPLISSVSNWKSRLYIRLSLAFSLALTVGIYVKSTHQFPKDFDEKRECSAIFSIDSLNLSSNYFGRQWIYKGTLKKVYDVGEGRLIGKNIPCLINMPDKKQIPRPEANKDYKLTGKLKLAEEGGYRFIIHKTAAWRPIDFTYSLAELRCTIKNQVIDYIQSRTENPRSAIFLAGIATGEFHDKEMLFEFARFGLQHILAISGFHFAIVAGILSLILRSLIPRKLSALLLTLILCSYFLFLGPTASIMRAWIMILIVMGGYLFEKSPIGLNSLGVAVMIILLMDPLMAYRLGFQFSVIVTASILMNYSWIDQLMQSILPKRPLSEVSIMNMLNQHGYCILAFFRQALSLGFAVNIAAIPVMLFYFGKFPLMSLIYNLFFPFLVSISMLFLILGILTSLAPPLSLLIHTLNSNYTAYVLNFAYNMPTTFDYFFRARIEHFEIVVTALSILFFISILAIHLMEKRRQEMQDFAFV